MAETAQLPRDIWIEPSGHPDIEHARKRGFRDKILAAIDRADGLKIAFIGETIIDEYRYVRALAKPSKEFILAVVGNEVERFEGGVIAASKHGEWARATCLTPQQSITKTRFVDADFSRKLFEVYSDRNIELKRNDRMIFNARLRETVRECDSCVVCDFGHGLFDESARQILEQARFLAITVQTNAGNYGFNPLTKYRKADYVVVDDPEARLAFGARDGLIESVMAGLLDRTQYRFMTVTHGRQGSTSFDVGKSAFASVPAFADGGSDTMGAGDAFLAVAGPLVAAGLDVDMAAFAGNVAGGLKTSILGHRKHVTRDDLVKHIEWLLK